MVLMFHSKSHSGEIREKKLTTTITATNWRCPEDHEKTSRSKLPCNIVFYASGTSDTFVSCFVAGKSLVLLEYFS